MFFLCLQKVDDNQSDSKDKSALESIVDREIRLQEEREQEVAAEHQHSLQAQKPAEKPAVTPVTSPPAAAAPRTRALSTPEPSRSLSPQPTQHRARSPSPQAPAVRASHPEGDMITYGVAISAKTHAGETLIARELREQREREEELQKHWEEIQQFKASEDGSVPPSARELVPPPSAQSPVQATKSAPKPGQAQPSTYQTEVTPFKQTSSQPATNASGRRGSVESNSSSAASSSQDGVRHQDPLQPPRYTRGVQPLGGDDEEEQVPFALRFLTKNETPVEREIRIAREREEELRRERGLPVNDASPDIPPAGADVVDSKPTNYHRSMSAPADKQAMKKLSSSRLMLEMGRERRREIDLHSEGKIKTTSEDHLTDLSTYAKTVNAEMVTTAKKFPKAKTPTEPSPSAEVMSPNEESPHQNGVSVTPTTPSKPEPAVVRRYSQLQPAEELDWNVSKGKPTMTRTENKIDSEMREMKEREEELR